MDSRFSFITIVLAAILVSCAGNDRQQALSFKNETKFSKRLTVYHKVSNKVYTLKNFKSVTLKRMRFVDANAYYYILKVELESSPEVEKFCGGGLVIRRMGNKELYLIHTIRKMAYFPCKYLKDVDLIIRGTDKELIITEESIRVIDISGNYILIE